MIFGIKSVIELKKNFLANPSTIKFLETKIISYGDETTDFHTKKVPEAGSNYICWLVILVDSVLQKDKNYYRHVFLKECKYVEKEEK